MHTGGGGGGPGQAVRTLPPRTFDGLPRPAAGGEPVARRLKVLLQREQNELAWRQQRIEQNRAALATLAAEYTASGWSNTLDGTEHLDNVDDIRIRLEALAESCVRESLAFHPVNALTQESIEAGVQATRREWI
ncbi:hypothetical protein [Streptomyces sp. NBC_00009]|uniref:hypothetical protein n=1 Tax=Streptomyces sp. NBC_00009 TaxID=2975620 RepID=UPI00324C3E0E